MALRRSGPRPGIPGRGGAAGAAQLTWVGPGGLEAGAGTGGSVQPHTGLLPAALAAPGSLPVKDAGP